MYKWIFFNRRRGSSLATHLSYYVLVKGPSCRNYLPNEFGKKGQLQSDLTGLSIFTTQTVYKAILFSKYMYRVRTEQFKTVVDIGTGKTILNSVYLCIQNRGMCRALVNAVMNLRVP